MTVEASFGDRVAADVACELLYDGSLVPEEPEAVGLRHWVVQVRGLTRPLARRAEVVLVIAGATGTRIVGEEPGIEPHPLPLITAPAEATISG